MVRSKTASTSNEKVSLDFLEGSTGFPKEFIKKELLLDDDHLTVDDLRKTMLRYLEEVTLEQEKSEPVLP